MANSQRALIKYTEQGELMSAKMSKEMPLKIVTFDSPKWLFSAIKQLKDRDFVRVNDPRKAKGE